MAEHKSGKATDLCDFVCNHFQKKVGIMSAVVEVSIVQVCLIDALVLSRSEAEAFPESAPSYLRCTIILI